METLEQDQLVHHLLLVGPKQSVTFEQVQSSSNQQEWQNITTPVPTILKCYSPQISSRQPQLATEVVYFCQPSGCCVELPAPKIHTFMLTDTESNVKTYGVCLSVPHLFDPQTTQPPQNRPPGKGPGVVELEVVNIQEWGVLSICLLSRHPFFNFFAKCLKTLSHFMEDFGAKKVGWNALLRAGSGDNSAAMQQKKSTFVADVEKWIGNLLSLPAPEAGRFGLEVELEVEPEVLVSYSTKSRLPLFELRLHQIFHRVGVHTFIEIYKLVLSEQKVILHSSDAAFSSECVMSVITLLYPLQYLYPVIPLLPSSLQTAENLLMVPTPYLIGVCDGFMKKVQDFQIAETWLVGLDTKKIQAPQIMDQPLLKFPLRILQLQADVRKALDRIHDLDLPDGNLASSLSPTLTTPTLTTPTNTPTLGEDYPNRGLSDEVDVIIRVAFVQFLFDEEILGHIDQYLCIFRLFPRPVVSLRTSPFLAAYRTKLDTSDTSFIQELIKTQCVEYFFQYSLNPSNFAYEEINRGVSEPERLMDKIHHSTTAQSGVKLVQVSLYSHSPDSVLYQEMLAHKASQQGGSSQEESCSDWEVLSGDNYDGDSEASSLSFFSEGANEELTPVGSGAICSGEDSLYYTPNMLEESGFGSSPATTRTKDGTIKRTKEGVVANNVPKVGLEHLLANPHPGGGVSGRLYLTDEDEDDDDVDTGFQLPQKEQSPGPTPNSLADHTPIVPGLKRRAGGTPLSKTSQAANLNSHSMDVVQMQDLVVKLVDGQGLPWPKPAFLKRLAGQERSRVAILRLLEERLGIREPGPMVMATSEQIIAVSVSKAVFKGLMEFMKYLLQSIEEELQKDPEAPTFSIFLILRMSFSVYLPSRPQKSTISVSLLNALNLSSFVTPGPTTVTNLPTTNSSTTTNPTTVTITNPSTTIKKKRVVATPRNKELLSTELPSISISDTDEETEELHIIRKVKHRGRRSSSPLLAGRNASDRTSALARIRNSYSLDYSVTEEGGAALLLPGHLSSIRGSAESLSDDVWSREALRDEESSERDLSSVSGGGGKSDTDSFSEREHGVPTTSLDSQLGENSGNRGTVVRSNTQGSSSPPTATTETPSSPLSERVRTLKTPKPQLSNHHHHQTPLQTSPLQASVLPSSQTGQFTPAPTGRVHPNRPLLLSELIDSPRFYHPKEGQDLSGCSFLYRELMKSLGGSRNFMLPRKFWNQLFISTLTVDRENLGWNEGTVSLYEKYNSLSEPDRQLFSFEEDSLLSILLHNLLVCMLLVGLTPQETTEIVHRLSAKTRLATVEEKLLQQTLKYIEGCIEEENSDKVDINLLGLMSLYSEVHPTLSYIVHYGMDVLAPVFKLQITDKVLILRRFSDDKICSRLWNDRISIVRYSKACATVSVCHKDIHGEFYHHFHTKQYMEVYGSLQALVSVESDSS